MWQVILSGVAHRGCGSQFTVFHCVDWTNLKTSTQHEGEERVKQAGCVREVLKVIEEDKKRESDRVSGKAIS